MDPSILSEDFKPLTKKDNALIRESNMHEEAGYVSRMSQYHLPNIRTRQKVLEEKLVELYSLCIV